ncbi:MAG: hypothetical protein J6L72_00090 [Butyricicoccus sp.]|nr:hypothetical protein [Butyricicoccus sp.]
MPDEYISREAAIEEIDKWLDSVGTALVGKGLSYYGELIGCIEDARAADVAEVVRCASCKYVRPTVNAHTGEQVGIWCCLHDILNVSPDDYCSRGEKKGTTE